MIIPIELNVTIDNENLSDINIARINLTESKIEWIKKMSRIVKRNKVAHISAYDCSATYLYRDDEETDPDNVTEPDTNTECDMIVITDTDFYFKGYIKHTSDTISTESISIKNGIDDLIKFYKETPLSQCPKYLNDENYSMREIAKQRMKGLSPAME